MKYPGAVVLRRLWSQLNTVYVPAVIRRRAANDMQKQGANFKFAVREIMEEVWIAALRFQLVQSDLYQMLPHDRRNPTALKLPWFWRVDEYEVLTPDIKEWVEKGPALMENRKLHDTIRGKKQKMGSVSEESDMGVLADMRRSLHVIVAVLQGEATQFVQVSPLHSASENWSFPLGQHLLDAGVDVSWSDQEGVTALHLAACKGEVSLVKSLLSSRCSPDNCTSAGLTPLHYAARHGHDAVVDALICARAEVNRVCSAGQSPLFVAAENGYLGSVRALLKTRVLVNLASNHGSTPLCAAVRKNHEEVALALLQHGGCVNTADRTNNLPLHYAVRSSNMRLASAILAAGSERNILNKNFESPVHIAVRMGDTLMLELLIKEGCDVNYCEPVGNVTPLHMAVNMQHNPAVFGQLFSLLLQGGCILNWRAYSTLETPLYRSLDVDREDICALLLSNGANPNLASPFDVTALQKACQRERVHLVNLMLNCSINWKRERWLQHYSILQGEVTKNREINDLLRSWKTEVISLQAQCRIQLRRILEENLEQKLQKLQIPQKVRSYILLQDLL